MGIGYLHPMSCDLFELHLQTLDGSVVTLDVPTTATVRELKAMLLEKHPKSEDPIERKILKVELLHDGSFIDNALTLAAAGLLGGAEVTVMYARNEVEAATKDDIQTHGFVQVSFPCLTEISACAFEHAYQLVRTTIPESVTRIEESAFDSVHLFAKHYHPSFSNRY